MLRILLVEDSADDADLVCFQLEDAGLQFELRRAWDARTIREALAAFEPSVAISDLNLPGYSGLEALALLHELRPRLPLVMLTGAADVALPGLPVAMLGKERLDQLAPLLANLRDRG